MGGRSRPCTTASSGGSSSSASTRCPRGCARCWCCATSSSSTPPRPPPASASPRRRCACASTARAAPWPTPSPRGWARRWRRPGASTATAAPACSSASWSPSRRPDLTTATARRTGTALLRVRAGAARREGGLEGGERSRLLDVVVEDVAPHGAAQARLGVAAERDDADAVADGPADQLGEGDAVDVGQADVEQRGVRLEPGGDLERLVAARRHRDLVAVITQRLAEDLGHLGLVVDHEDPHLE